MDCYRVRRILAAYLEDGPPPGERDKVRSHLAKCRNCLTLSQQYARERAALKALPAAKPPRHLITALRVLASRERARRLAGERLPAPMVQWLASFRIRASILMRPLALPLAGGLVSALVLFALVIPNFMPHRSVIGSDVPTMLSTEPIFVSMGPFGFGEDEVVVDLTVDKHGRFVGYSLPSGQTWGRDPEARKTVENALLFTRFAPGTTFGLPSSAKVRITLRRSHIDVRG
jgi:hypothetical protein